MFRLVYQHFTVKHGWKNGQENFTSGEHRTVVEIARERLADTAKYRNVRVIDERLVLVSLITLTPAWDKLFAETDGRGYNPKASSVQAKVPACSILDLATLPRKKVSKAKKVPVAKASDFTPKAKEPKAKRTSKRQRQYVSPLDRAISEAYAVV
jgi:hypothetical protein